MKLSPATLQLLAAALVASSSAVSAKSVEHPELVPFDKSQLSKDSYFEDFQGEIDWSESHAKKDDEFTYVGKWSVEEASVYPGFKNDKGLVLKSPAAHHAITTKLSQPFDNTDNTLVLQYEVKLQEGLQCGGAYIKLLSADGFPEGNEDQFNNETPYEIMFGPDKCGSTNKVHFIVRRPHPVTGEIEEKHLKMPPLARVVKNSNLYTLIIKPDNDFEVRINGEVAKLGNLLDEDSFKPAFNPPKLIEDPDDVKPEDWDEREQIPDPEQLSKPDDWDEDAPKKIPDPDAVKPEDWDEEAPNYIADPEAEKPEDWDDEEDGEWLAPQIPNPVCETSGCGPWSLPLIPNPNYKGKWVQPMIANPDYKGQWSPREIPNPDYYEDTNASNLAPIGGLGFELWTLQPNILFDNIYLGHSIDEAELIGNSTFVPKLEIEQEVIDAENPKPEFEPEEPPVQDDFGASSSKASELLDFVITKFNNFLADAHDFYLDLKESPVETVTSRPFEAIYYLAISLYSLIIATGIWGAIVFLVTGGPSKPAASTTTVAASTTTTTVDADGNIEEVKEEIIEEITENVDASGVSKE